MGEQGKSSKGFPRRGFTGPYSIYCDESGENVVSLLEGDDFARSFERSESVQEYVREKEKVGLEEKMQAKESTMLVSDVPKFDAARKKTKIVCAIGPSSRSVEMLLELLEAGMNVARLNFSHGDHAYHLESLRNLRLAVQLRRSWGFECHCAVLLDTKGPEIRTGYLQDGQPIQIHAGQLLEITSDYSYKGNTKRIACSYKELSTSVQPGGTILVADGEIMMEVVECRSEQELVVVRVQNTAVLEERKNMNLPGVTVKLPGITEKDIYDIKNFALVHRVDIVSGSFIRTAANVHALKDCLGEEGKNIRVHAKIESVEGLKNVDEIIEAADGIHVSRGDLGMELPLSKICLAQKLITHKANIAGKPVVTSTQMLQSMVDSVRPTSAECSDVANAVLDGTDCVMLSAETAKGKYPREAVETMARIITEAERCMNYETTSRAISDEVISKGFVDVIEALADASVETAYEAEASVMAVVSETGRLPMLVAKYRPKARLLVTTANPVTARQLSVTRGVYTTLVTRTLLENDFDLWVHVCRISKENGWIKTSGRAIMVHTALYGGILSHKAIQENDPRLKNVIKIMVVPENVEELAQMYPTLQRGVKRSNSN